MRSKKKQKSPIGHQSKTVLVVIALFGISYLIWRGTRNTSEQPQKSTTPASTEDNSKPRSKPNRSAKVSAREKLASNKADVGLNQVEMQIDAQGNAYLHVVIKKKPVCHPGDYEALTQSFGANGSVLLTLEPMNHHGKLKPATQLISLKQMFRAEGYALPIDLREKAVYGIYLCGDQKSEAKCSQKKPVDFNQILNKQNMESNRNGIFYYQFAVLGGNDNRVYSGSAERVANVREMNQRDEEKIKNIDITLKQASKMLGSVKSYPAQPKHTNNGWTLELAIAAMDGAACGKR